MLHESVVPALLAASSVSQKNQVLCAGIYSYFSTTNGIRAVQENKRQRKFHPSQAALNKLRKDRNVATCRNELRRAKTQGNDKDAINSLAKKFYLLF